MSEPATNLAVALVGNPNTGKSTLFNALTGLRQRVGNYPGVTVARKSGTCDLGDGRKVELVDLPGLYSLAAASPDEQVVTDALAGKIAGERVPDVIVVVADATNLLRNLFLASQLAPCSRRRRRFSARPCRALLWLPPALRGFCSALFSFPAAGVEPAPARRARASERAALLPLFLLCPPP